MTMQGSHAVLCSTSSSRLESSVSVGGPNMLERAQYDFFLGFRLDHLAVGFGVPALGVGTCC